MRKYFLIDDETQASAVIFTEAFNTLEEAKKAGQRTVDYMTESEKKKSGGVFILYGEPLEDDEDNTDWNTAEEVYRFI